MISPFFLDTICFEIVCAWYNFCFSSWWLIVRWSSLLEPVLWPRIALYSDELMWEQQVMGHFWSLPIHKEKRDFCHLFSDMMPCSVFSPLFSDPIPYIHAMYSYVCCTDDPSIYSILRVVPSNFRTPCTESIRLSTSGSSLNTRSTWSMSSTEGPNTASTGSMSSTCPRVQAVSAVSICEVLGVLRVSRVLNPEILRVHKVPGVPFLEKYSNYTYFQVSNRSTCEMWNAIINASHMIPEPWE